jgi:hypothetical protein
MNGDNDDTGSSESPLDDLFVEGARFREPSAAERAAWAKEQRKQVKKSKRRRERQHGQTARSGRRPLIAIAVLFVLAFVIFYVFNPGGGGSGSNNDNAALLKDQPREVAVSYLVPQGVTPDPNAAAAIQADLAQTQAWFAEQTGGKQLRFRENADGTIDVAQRPLNASLADLKSQTTAGNTVRDALPHNDQAINIAFVPVDRRTDCGEGAMGYAVVYMGSCGWSSGGTRVAAHELLHALGAVAPCAPHIAPGNNVTQPTNDVMYAGAERENANVQLDPGHDDYYKHHIKNCIDVADHPAWTSA